MRRRIQPFQIIAYVIDHIVLLQPEECSRLVVDEVIAPMMLRFLDLLFIFFEFKNKFGFFEERTGLLLFHFFQLSSEVIDLEEDFRVAEVSLRVDSL